MTELYFSTDVETNGKIPGRNAMLSFASTTVNEDGWTGESFERNLKLLEGSNPDPDTEKFWQANPEAYAATRINQIHPAQAMQEYVSWIKQQCKKYNATPVFAAHPAGFDFLFVYWYLIYFTNDSPFSFSALDIKTAAWALAEAKVGYRSVNKNFLKRNYPTNLVHTHIAADDAQEQGEILGGILRARKK